MNKNKLRAKIDEKIARMHMHSKALKNHDVKSLSMFCEELQRMGKLLEALEQEIIGLVSKHKISRLQKQRNQMLNIKKFLEKIFEQLISEPLASKEVTTKNNYGFMKIEIVISRPKFHF